MQIQAQPIWALQGELLEKKMETNIDIKFTIFRNEIREEFREIRNELRDIRTDLANFKVEIKQEIHDLRQEFGARLTVVETILRIRQQKGTEIRTRFLDYSFKAGWLIIFAAVANAPFLIHSLYSHHL